VHGGGGRPKAAERSHLAIATTACALRHHRDPRRADRGTASERHLLAGSNFSINTPSGRLSSPTGSFGGVEARWTAYVDK
jgi:hypothetical protein